jgi:LmeA-like phospholipid-binding
MPSSRAARIALVAVAGVVGLLIVAQFVLPPLAERSIRGKVDDVATVEDVKVSAFPAVKLLWKHADKVEVRLGEVRSGTGKFADLVDEARGVNEVDVTAGKAMIGDAELTRAEFHKDGDDLVGTGFMSEDAILAALPLGFRVKPVRTEEGQLIVRGSPGILGGAVGVEGRVVTQDGAIVVNPENVPLVGGLVDYTVFTDDRITVKSVGARKIGRNFVITARGTLN